MQGRKVFPQSLGVLCAKFDSKEFSPGCFR